MSETNVSWLQQCPAKLRIQICGQSHVSGGYKISKQFLVFLVYMVNGFRFDKVLPSQCGRKLQTAHLWKSSMKAVIKGKH